MSKIMWIFLLCSFSTGVVGYTGFDVHDVITKLFTTDGYNNKIRPLKDQGNTLNVNVDFYLNSVIGFDEQEEVLTTSGYLWLDWIDEYLRWDPASYNGTTEIFLPQADIWKPDIALRNTYKTFLGLGSSYLNVRVSYDGQVLWMPFQILQSTCAVDIKYFPFDKQLCNIKFTAWSYSIFEIDLNAGSNGVTLQEFSPNAQWQLTNTFYKEVNTGEAAVIFQIELKRKPGFYIINVITPVVMLSILNVCAFLLPVASGEKAGYSVTVFLSLAVFLTIIASELPKNSDVVSLMAIYLTIMSGLSTFIVALSLLQIRLSVRCSKKTPIKGFFMFLVKVSRFLRCQSCSKANKVEELNNEEKISLKSESNDEYDWSDVNDAIDYIFFWISLIFTIVCTCSIFGICVSHSSDDGDTSSTN